MEHGEPSNGAAAFENIDDAPRSELRHRETRNVCECLFVVERLEQSAAYLGEEERSALGPPPVDANGFRRARSRCGVVVLNLSSAS
jgi:hypothetical protein